MKMEHERNICRLCLQEGLLVTTISENSDSPEARAIKIFGWNFASAQNVQSDRYAQICFICRQELIRLITVKSLWEQASIKISKMLTKSLGLVESKQESEGHSEAVDGNTKEDIINLGNHLQFSENIENSNLADDHRTMVVKNENNNELLLQTKGDTKKVLESVTTSVIQGNTKDIADECPGENVFRNVEKIDLSKNVLAPDSEDIIKIEIEDHHHIKPELAESEIDEELGFEEEYQDECAFVLNSSDSFEEDKEIEESNNNAERQKINSIYQNNVGLTCSSTSQRTLKKRKHKICKCELCGKTFRYELWWKKHMELHETKQLADCEVCGKWFNDKKLLSEHWKIHEPKVPRPKVVHKFECNDCGAVFSQKSMLAVHVQRHLGIYPLKCEICSKGFFYPKELRNHHISHTGERQFECAHCGKRYMKKPHLAQHIIALHSNVKSFTCKVCDRSFSLGYQLRQHLKVHTGEKNAKCNVCGKLFTRKTQLIRHNLIHTGEKPFKCHLCQRKFLTNIDLKRHIKFHAEGKPYKCDICQEQFMRAFNLQNHIRIHTGEKPYKCNSCGKAFAQTSALRTHEKAVRGCGANYTAKNRKKRTKKNIESDT